MADEPEATEIGSLLLVVAAALMDRDGQVLVQQRPAGRMMSGLWEFPGGKVERGESPEHALIRELREELGITVAAGDLVPAGFASEPLGGRHLVLMLYLCRAWAGNPRAIDADRLLWCAPRVLRTLDMPPADRPLIAVLEALV